MLYTVIRHDLCKLLGLNLLEYVILDIVSQQCRNISMNGWAVIDKKGIGELVGVSDAKAWNVICKLAQFDFIEINDLAKQMRVTDKFLSVVNGGLIIPEKEKEEKVKDITPKDIKVGDNKVYTEEEKQAFHNFNEWIKLNAPRVAKMPEQMTIDEFLKIRKRMDRVKITELLTKMHNWQPLLSKNRRVYTTMCNWDNRDEK